MKVSHLHTLLYFEEVVKEIKMPRSITHRKSIAILLGWLVLMLLVFAYGLWPRSSGVLARRSEVAEAFMTNLSIGNSQAALEQIIHAPEKYAAIARDFSNPDNFPVSWVLETPNRNDVIKGQALFPDGKELEVTFYLTWDWEWARWGITGVYFGQVSNEAKMYFDLTHTTLPYHWFGWGIAIVSLVLVGLGIRMVAKQEERKGRLVYGRRGQ